MTNIIIIIILIIFFSLGIKEVIKHFRGEGSCCGGGSARIRKKKLKNRIIQKYILKIEGMSCKQCIYTVTEIINEFEGVAGRVNLSKSEGVVLCDREVNIEDIKEKIRRCGYKVL